jgi:hypothetical protein
MYVENRMKWYHRLTLGMGILFGILSILNALSTPNEIERTTRCISAMLICIFAFIVIPN